MTKRAMVKTIASLLAIISTITTANWLVYNYTDDIRDRIKALEDKYAVVKDKDPSISLKIIHHFCTSLCFQTG